MVGKRAPVSVAHRLGSNSPPVRASPDKAGSESLLSTLVRKASGMGNALSTAQSTATHRLMYMLNDCSVRESLASFLCTYGAWAMAERFPAAHFLPPLYRYHDYATTASTVAETGRNDGLKSA